MEILIGNRVRVNGGKNASLLGRIGTVTKLPSTPDGEYEVTFDGGVTNEDQSSIVEHIFESDFELVQEPSSSPVPSSEEESTTPAPGAGESTTPTTETVAAAAPQEDNNEEDEEEEPSATWPAWPTRKEATGISLSQVDKSTWIGRPVMVMKGPKTGSMGRVYSTASGWVEIHEAGKDGSDPFLLTASGGEAPPINKRAHELNLMKLFNEDGAEEDDDESGSIERGDSATGAKDFQVGDLVVVLEGAHEGKNGKITEIDGDRLALSIKAVSAIVHKTKSQVEHKKDVRPSTAQQQQRRGPKKKEVGGAADLIGKRVMVLDTGKVGIVVKCGQGLFEVEVNGEDSIGEMKRRDELRVLDDEETTAAAAEDDSGDDEANGNGSAANRVRRKRKLRNPASNNSAMVAAAEEEEKKRPRITRRTGPQAAPAAGGNKKQNNVSESITTTKLEATRKQRQEIMAHFVTRWKERQDKQMPNRENLQDWLDDLKSFASTCHCCTGRADEDTSVPLLFDFAYCNICRVEMHQDAEFCWNPACWKSPVYRQDAAPLVEDAYPRELISNIFVNPCAQVKVSPLVTLSLTPPPNAKKEEDEEEVKGFFGNGVQDDDDTALPGFARAHLLDRRWKRQQLA